MATTLHYQLRADEASNWEEKNPALWPNELGYDKTNRRIKFGDGQTQWNELEYIAPDVVDSLDSTRTDAALSADKGRELNEQKVSYDDVITPSLEVLREAAASTSQAASVLLAKNILALVDTKASTEELNRKIDNLPEPEKVEVIDNLESQNVTAALSANQGRVLNERKLGTSDVINTTFSLVTRTERNSYATRDIVGMRTLKSVMESLVTDDDVVNDSPNKVLSEDTAYTNGQVPSMKMFKKLFTDNVMKYADVLNPNLSTLREKTISDYTTKQALCVRAALQLLKLIDEKVSSSDFTTEQWTFTLEDDSTVTKRVTLWSS